MAHDDDSDEEEREKEEEEKHNIAAWLLGFEGIRRLVVTVLKLPVTDDSRIYQMNCRYSVVVLCVFAIGVSLRHLVGNPIKCWCPAELERFQVAYVDSYCWVSNTYYVPFDGTIPEKSSDREDEEISYYQWVPIILVLQAFLFYMPRLIWKSFCTYSGFNLKKAIHMAYTATYAQPEKQTEQISNLVSYLDSWIEIRDNVLSSHTRNGRIVLKEKLHGFGFNHGNLLTFLFLFTGVLYTANSVSQIFLLDMLLNNDFRTVGVDFIISMVKNKTSREFSRFPRITFCDLDIRQMANVQKWTVQCSLPINLFNEKMFLIIWFMLVILSAINCVYILYNTYLFTISSWRHDYVNKYLILRDPENFPSRKITHKFVDTYLKNDGVFVLWMLGHNANPIITMEIVEELWENYRRKPNLNDL